MAVSFCQLTTTANHGAGQFASRKMTLSSILYIIFLELNILFSTGGDTRESAYAHTREATGFASQSKKSYQEEIFLIYGFVNPT